MKWFYLLTTMFFCLSTLSVRAETTWDVIAMDSRLSFTLQIGGSDTAGHFENWSADIIYDPICPIVRVFSLQSISHPRKSTMTKPDRSWPQPLGSAHKPFRRPSLLVRV